MPTAFAVFVVVFSLVGSVFLSLALLGVSRRVQERAARTAMARADKLAQIPVAERVATYTALGLVIASVLAFRWAPIEGGSDIRILAFATAAAALSFVVWFSVRWWHLK